MSSFISNCKCPFDTWRNYSEISLARPLVSNLPISTNNKHLSEINGPSWAQFSRPLTSAMLTGYPGISSHRQQNQYFFPISEQPCRPGSYNVASAKSSLTAANFSQSRHTSLNLWPFPSEPHHFIDQCLGCFLWLLVYLAALRYYLPQAYPLQLPLCFRPDSIFKSMFPFMWCSPWWNEYICPPESDR